MSAILRKSLNVILGSLTLAVSLAALVMGAPPETAVEPVELLVGEHWHIKHPTHHVQGLCVDDDFFWISSVERATKLGWIYKVDRPTLKVLAKAELVDGDRFHPGGMQLIDGMIWVPLAEYRPRSSSIILALDADTLEEVSRFAADDHLGGVAVDDQGNVYAANWDTRQIYVFDRDGNQLRVVDSPTGVAYQDFEHHNGLLWGTGRTKLNGKMCSVVDVLAPSEMQLRHRIILSGKTATVEDYFAREGLSIHDGSLFLMPEDGPETRVYQFSLKDTPLEKLLKTAD